MLHSRLRPLPRQPQPSFDEPSTPDESPEDLFTSFLPHLFPDDAPPFHGDPGQRLVYASPRYGELDIMVPAYPSQSEKRSEEIAAGLVKRARTAASTRSTRGGSCLRIFCGARLWLLRRGVEKAAAEDSDMWSVRGERVLELGAGKYAPCCQMDGFYKKLTDDKAPPSPPSSPPSPKPPK